jgi:hydrogenase maturation protease
MNTLVLGLGNLVHSDDGVGVHAVQALQNDVRVPADVSVIDGGTHGLSLIAYLTGIERLLVLDAIDAGQSPGAIVRLEGDALKKWPGRPSVHQLSLADLFIALELLDASPRQVVVLGVQPQSTGWGAELTAPVHDSLARLLDLSIAQLEAWRSDDGHPGNSVELSR